MKRPEAQIKVLVSHPGSSREDRRRASRDRGHSRHWRKPHRYNCVMINDRGRKERKKDKTCNSRAVLADLLSRLPASSGDLEFGRGGS